MLPRRLRSTHRSSTSSSLLQKQAKARAAENSHSIEARNLVSPLYDGAPPTAPSLSQKPQEAIVNRFARDCQRRASRDFLLARRGPLAACLAAAPAACADGQLVGDPRGDAKGNGVLDIASVRHGYRAQLLAHRLTTYRRWRRALLVNGGEISFYFTPMPTQRSSGGSTVRYRAERSQR